jgi:hypothetical protein
MLSKVNIDELNPDSREFYERALIKFNASLFLGSLGMMFLGLCASTGGLSNSFGQLGAINGISCK